MFYEGSVKTFASSNFNDNSVVYTPRPIARKTFALNNNTLGKMSDAETSWIRIDEQSTNFPWASALRNSLICLESIATIAIDGTCPSLEAVMLLRAQREAEEDGYQSKANINENATDKKQQAAKAALYYEKILHDCFLIKPDYFFSQDTILEMHQTLMHGDDKGDCAHFRKKPFKARFNIDDKNIAVYAPPEPEAIPNLIDDLAQFCNTSRHSAVTQAAIAHFQLESIMPFKSGMDRTGRALVHTILKARKFSQHLTPPIALVPAEDAEKHAALLFPYRTGICYTQEAATQALNDWILHCAKCVELAVSVTYVMKREIANLEEKWHQLIPNIRNGTALEILLDELPGLPIVTVASAMSLTGKSFSACNDAITQLQNANILTAMNKGQRNRCFGSPEALLMYKDTMKAVLPKETVPRDRQFAQTHRP